MKKQRKPVVRRFLMNHYQTISVLLIVPALFMIFGITGWVIDTCQSLLPHHIPMIIASVIMMILGSGLIWIYNER